MPKQTPMLLRYQYFGATKRPASLPLMDKLFLRCKTLIKQLLICLSYPVIKLQ